MAQTQPEHWSLDKRIPIALIIGMALQFIGFVIAGAVFVTSTNARLNAIETKLFVTQDTRERLIRVEASTRTIEKQIERIEDKLDDAINSDAD